MQTRSLRAAIELRGLWLNPGPVRTSIKPLLLHMLERTHPDPVLREPVLEELQRRTKFKDVIFRALGVQERSVDQEGDCPIGAHFRFFLHGIPFMPPLAAHRPVHSFDL